MLDGTEDFALAAAVTDITRAECELTAAPLLVAISDGARIDAPGNRRARFGTAATIDTVVFPGVGHAMGKLEALQRGLSWAYCGARGRAAAAP